MAGWLPYFHSQNGVRQNKKSWQYASEVGALSHGREFSPRVAAAYKYIVFLALRMF